MRHRSWSILGGMGCALSACALDTTGRESANVSAALAATEPERPVVGTTRIEIRVGPDRALPVQLWYPTTADRQKEAEEGHSVSEFEPPGPRRMLIERLLPNAPSACTSRKMHAALDAPVAESPAGFPLLVYSHHLEGVRWAQFSAAEALAQHGFVVAAPDHTGRTLFDRTDDLQTADVLGTLLRSGLDDLAVRASDIEHVLDVMLAPAGTELPEDLRGRIDADRVGLFGHSMGSMTIGVAAARNTRVHAAAFLAYPPAQVTPPFDLLGQPTIEEFEIPGLFMLNQEDAPLGTVSGLDSIRAQFEAYRPPAYLVEVRDTGHWSFADDCGLIADFLDGCGQGQRHGAPYREFAFLDNAHAREIAARYVTAFFTHHLSAEDPDQVLALPASPDTIVRAHSALVE